MMVQSMKEINSGYIGTKEAWSKLFEFFLLNKQVWEKDELTLSKEFLAIIELRLFNNKQRKEMAGFPKSYNDFMASNIPEIVDEFYRIDGVGEARFLDNIVSVKNLNLKSKSKDIRYSGLITDVKLRRNLSDWQGIADHNPNRYYKYGPKNHNNTFTSLKNWVDIIENSLIVAETWEANGEIILLSPMQETLDGEWEASVNNGGGALLRYRSFAELALYHFFEQIMGGWYSIGENKYFDEALSFFFDLNILKQNT